MEGQPNLWTPSLYNHLIITTTLEAFSNPNFSFMAYMKTHFDVWCLLEVWPILHSSIVLTLCQAIRILNSILEKKSVSYQRIACHEQSNKKMRLLVVFANNIESVNFFWLLLKSTC